MADDASQYHSQSNMNRVFRAGQEQLRGAAWAITIVSLVAVAIGCGLAWIA
jgi:hypothetical protein